MQSSTCSSVSPGHEQVVNWTLILHVGPFEAEGPTQQEACVLGINEKPVAIKTTELSIIEKLSQTAPSFFVTPGIPELCLGRGKVPSAFLLSRDSRQFQGSDSRAISSEPLPRSLYQHKDDAATHLCEARYNQASIKRVVRKFSTVLDKPTQQGSTSIS